MNRAEPPDDLEALAGEYVLGSLEAAQRQAVERRLAHDTPLRSAVDAWEARLHPLTALAPAVEPPPALWHRIEQSLEQGIEPATPKSVRAAPATRGWQAWWASLALWRGLAAAGFAAALLLALRPTPPESELTAQFVVVLVAPGGQAPGWVVQVKTPRDLTLTPLARTATPDDKALQFWTKADGWSAPVSLGLVRAGEPLRLRLENLPALQPNQLFEITLEPAVGSPTGRPTGPIQFIGRAVKLDT